MTLKDTFILVGAKLKVRKSRTVVTVATISVLFGVAIAALTVMKGFSNSLMEYSQITFGGRVMLKVEHDGVQPIRDPIAMARAIELYEASDDPNKEYPVHEVPTGPDGVVYPPYIDSTNPIGRAALEDTEPARAKAAVEGVAEFVDPYGGRAMAIERLYTTGGFVNIPQMITPNAQDQIDFNSHAPCWNGCAGGRVIAIDGDDSILVPLVQITDKKDDVVQVLVPLNRAAQAIGVNVPSLDADPDDIRSYMEEVNERAVGTRFTGIITVDVDGDGKKIEATNITYEIVGLLPAESDMQYGISSIADIARALNDNIFEAALLNLGIISVNPGDAAPFIVTNPESSVFRASYTTDLDSQYKNVIVAFDSVEAAETFMEENKHIWPQDFLNNMREVFYTANSMGDATISIAFVLSVIAVLVMFGTVSRIIDDERQTIALYRAVGASTGNIVQVFFAYMMTLSAFIVVGSTVIGLAISGIIAMINSAFVAVRVALIYNLPEITSVSFFGFDPHIFIIYLAIFAVGAACLALILGKLMSKNIVKDLRK